MFVSILDLLDLLPIVSGHLGNIRHELLLMVWASISTGHWLTTSTSSASQVPSTFAGKADCRLKVLCLEWFPKHIAVSFTRRRAIQAPCPLLLEDFAWVTLVVTKKFSLHEFPTSSSLNVIKFQSSLPVLYSCIPPTLCLIVPVSSPTAKCIVFPFAGRFMHHPLSCSIYLASVCLWIVEWLSLIYS